MASRRRLTVPIWTILAAAGLAGLGWMFAFYLLGQVSTTVDSPLKVISSFGIEVAKAFFIGSTAGVFLKLMIEGLNKDDPREVLAANDIHAIHPSRSACADAFLRQVNDPGVGEIFILGISLRDFLSATGPLHGVWGAIYSRLDREEKQSKSEAERLKVHLLLLDHQSAEGWFRHRVEEPNIAPGGLMVDVPNGLKTIDDSAKRLYREEAQRYVNVRVYEHGSFAFTFASDTSIFIEQYLYRDHSQPSAMPVLEYGSSSPAYKALSESVRVIWDYGTPPDINGHHVGVARALREAQIRNIYREDERHELGRRQIKCLRSVEGATVSIMAITGRFYTSGYALDALQRASRASKDRQPVSVRILLLNPVSAQAILRAVADARRKGNALDKLSGWSWDEHKESDLYQDSRVAIRRIKELQDDGCDVELRLTSANLTCAMFVTPRHAFVEQYIYGRSDPEALVLGGEYPVFEYALDGNEGVEKDVLNSSFEVMWSFSMESEKFEQVEQKSKFETNFAALEAAMMSEGNGLAETPASPTSKAPTPSSTADSVTP